MSTKQDSNINLLYSNNLPFFFNLSDRLSYPLESLTLYEVKINYWYTKENLDDNITFQQYTNLTYKQCNIYENFNDYKKNCLNEKDLKTFFCLDLRDENTTIFGSCGDLNPFGFFHFEFYICKNESTNNQCLPKEEIKIILDDAYIDLRYIKFNVESNKQHVKSISIKSENVPISYSVYKRLWINFKTIEFFSDNGLIFTKNSKEFFINLVI